VRTGIAKTMERVVVFFGCGMGDTPAVFIQMSAVRLRSAETG
jgi:hypothetical protein